MPGLGDAVRESLVACFTVAEAYSCPDRLSSAVDLLSTALAYHPTLQSLLLYPCKLESDPALALPPAGKVHC